MPPKKRQRTSQSNVKGPSEPQSMAEVASGRHQLKDWIQVAFQGRHGFPEGRTFPLNQGGSYLDIVQRCWSDEDAIITDSLELVKKLGIMDSSSTEDDFIKKYLQLQEPTM